MKANSRFPQTVEAYKAHLLEARPSYDSFQNFCRKRGVCYKGVAQWMRRHNLSVGSLRLEAMLEKADPKSSLEDTLIDLSSQPFPIIKSGKTPRSIPLDQYIKGATLVFPDGVSISIRQTTPKALISIVESYNKLTTTHYAQPE